MDNEIFTSSDLALVALLSLTFEIENIDRTDPKRVIFSFKKSKELDKKVLDFTNNKLKVNPLAYFNKVREIKSAIYDRKQRTEPVKDK